MQAQAPNVPYNNTTARTESLTSAVSWAPVLAGSLTAIAISLILLFLGSAMGFAALSPWANAGASAAAVGISTLIGLVVMQLVASALGGYLTGRLRSKWSNLTGDETFFRDSAHGFLAWALATLVTAMCLTSTISSVAAAGAGAATTVAASAAAGAGYAMHQNNGTPEGRNSTLGGFLTRDMTSYYVDNLYRSNQGNLTPADSRGEATRILVNSVKTGTLTEGDKGRLAQLIANNSNITTTEANQRIDQVITQINEAKVQAKLKLDEARKAAAKLSLYAFLSLLVGAFVASAAAIYGGRHRDEY